MCVAGLMYGYEPYSQIQAGAAQNKYMQYLADQSVAEGKLALATADKQSTLIQDTAKNEGKQLKGQQAEFNASQRAIMAANGVMGGTSVEDITNSTFNKQQLDEMSLLHNANIKSWETNTQAQYKDWALRTKADDLRYQGKAAKYAGKVKAATTLLGSAKQVLSLGLGAA